jgi:HPt (histidine-containing phosphotransfer) domain-containing protein
VAVPANGPPINVADALDRLDGNRKLYGELLEIFRGHHSGDREKFHEAMASGDRKKAHRVVHTLKGVAGNLGMPRLRATAAKLQEHLESQGEIPEELRQQFEVHFAEVMEAVAPALAEAARTDAGASPQP